MSVENLKKTYQLFEGIGYGEVMAGNQLYTRTYMEHGLDDAVEIFEEESGEVVVSMYSDDNDSKKDLYFTADQLAEAVIENGSISIMEENVKITIKLPSPALSLDEEKVFKGDTQASMEESTAPSAIKQ